MSKFHWRMVTFGYRYNPDRTHTVRCKEWPDGSITMTERQYDAHLIDNWWPKPIGVNEVQVLWKRYDGTEFVRRLV